MKKNICLLITLFAVICNVNAQIKIHGTVHDVNNVGIEYATVCADSIYTLTNQDGKFTLELPHGFNGPMTCTHVSYQKNIIPYSLYKTGTVNISMEEKVYELQDALIVNKQNKPVTILRKGMKMPGDVVFGNTPSGKFEIGPKFTSHDHFIIDNFNLQVEECTYEQCTLRIIVYEIAGGRFEPIHPKPIYFNLTPTNHNSAIKINVDSPITLQKGKEYYIGITIVAGANGTIHFPATLRSGFIRNLITGTMKKLPATVGIGVTGRKQTTIKK